MPSVVCLGAFYLFIFYFFCRALFRVPRFHGAEKMCRSFFVAAPKATRPAWAALLTLPASCEYLSLLFCLINCICSLARAKTIQEEERQSSKNTPRLMSVLCSLHAPESKMLFRAHGLFAADFEGSKF